MSIKVCVTGATGFIASHIVQILLEKGYYVNATVRSLTLSQKNQFLFQFIEKYRDSDGNPLLTLFEADLMKDNSFDSAFEACDYVIHVASPVFLTSKDPINDIITPAIEGTKRILQACTKAKTVKRLILTSSVSALYDRTNTNQNIVYTEKDWHTDTDLYDDPYPYAKTQAEKVAWKYVEDNPEGFDLVTIHPSMTIGPTLNGYISSSNSTILSLFTSQYPLIANINFCFVDVRDVALAHVLAMENPSAKGRYIVSNKNMWYPEAAKFIHDSFKSQSISYKRAPSWLVYLLAMFDSRISWSYLRGSLDIERRYSNEKIQKELGLKFRPIEETIFDACNGFIEFGLDKKPQTKPNHYKIITLAIIAGIAGSSVYAYKRWFRR